MRDKAKEDELIALRKQHPDWGNRKLAAATGIPRTTVSNWLAQQLLIAKLQGAREGFTVNGVSTFTNKNGEVSEWVKTDRDRSRDFELLQVAVDELIEGIKGGSEFVPPPAPGHEDLLVVYPFTDFHLGLFSYGKETGEDWDLKISERTILDCVEYLVNAAPPAKHCLIPNLGDFFHTDNGRNQTEKGGNILDVDTRQPKIYWTGVMVFKRCIELALAKHENVVVKAARGNHDEYSGYSLAAVMKAFFWNNPRVEIELPINPFGYHEFGKNLIGIHHGALKPDKYPNIMACDQSEAWGRTLYRTFMTGHIHHKTKHEFPGCVVESFRSPAAKDGWTHSMGYRAQRTMELIVYHSETGEESRTFKRVGE